MLTRTVAIELAHKLKDKLCRLYVTGCGLPANCVRDFGEVRPQELPEKEPQFLRFRMTRGQGLDHNDFALPRHFPPLP
jgi:hypothetical protein